MGAVSGFAVGSVGFTGALAGSVVGTVSVMGTSIVSTTEELCSGSGSGPMAVAVVMGVVIKHTATNVVKINAMAVIQTPGLR